MSLECRPRTRSQRSQPGELGLEDLVSAAGSSEDAPAEPVPVPRCQQQVWRIVSKDAQKL